MPEYTDTYSIPWYTEDDTITEAIEKRRAVTIDNQLYAFATIFGNGVIAGWDVEGNLTGFQVSISLGRGLIRWLACETTVTSVLDSLPANRSMDEPIYVYVTYTDTSSQDRTVSFFYNTTGVAPAFALLLAKVATDSTGVIEVDTSVKETLDFFANIASEVINHIHIGGDNNPSPIDLVSHVTGSLAQSMIEEIDGSKITGQISAERLAQIQHTALSNIGSNSHNQIDTLLNLLNTTPISHMGDVAVSDFLQLLLAVKHFWTNIDEYLHNAFAFIPGITPDSFIDLVNTDATIDKQNHQITGNVGNTREGVVQIYDSTTDFNKNVSNSNIVISNSGTIYLTKPATTYTEEDFTSISDWSYTVVSSDGSEISIVDGHGQYDVDETFQVKFYKTISGVDWEDYNRIEFDFNVVYTEHGAIYLQITNGSTANTAVQLLGENAITDGWVTKTINLSAMDTDDVTELAFYTEILANDVNKIFNFGIETVYLITDILYSAIGTINFIFSTDQTTDWEQLYWDADTPGDSRVEAKTRSADTLVALDLTTFSPALTESGSYVISSDSKFLEIQFSLIASSNQLQTSILNDFTLNYTTSALVANWDIDNQVEWNDNVETAVNLSVLSGKIEIDSTAGVGAYQFIHFQSAVSGDETIEGIDEGGNRISNLVVDGSQLPISPLQAVTEIGAAFYELKSVQRLESRGYMVADTGNDRVFELDADGVVVWGLLANSLNSSSTFQPLTATYNTNNRELGISFNKAVDADSIDLTKITVLKGQTLITLAPGSETSSQENLNFITITLSVTHDALLDDSVGDMSITVAANAIEDSNDTILALSYNFSVFEGNVYWSRIFAPVHAFKQGDYYTISHVGGSNYLAPILEVDANANTAWSFSEVSFSVANLGSTEKDSDGDNYVVADSGNKRVIRINRSSSVVTFTKTFENYPVRATEVSNGNILTTISDGVGDSGSRIVEVDSEGGINFEFGWGLLKNPTSAVKLNNNHYVITM